MRILFVGNLNIKHRGERYYTQGAKLVNGFIRNGHNVFTISDRDIARSAILFGFKALGQRYCNQYFLDVCKNFQPEFIIFHHADIIKTDTVAEAKIILPSVKIAQFNVDPIFRDHNMKMIRNKLPVVDGTFITTAGEELKRFNNPNGFVSFVPNIVDSSMESLKCHENSSQQADVFWALRPSKNYHPDDPRIAYPLFIEKSGKAKINYYGMNGKPPLMNIEYYNKISECKMGLNLSVVGDRAGVDFAKASEMYLYSSDRISHYMGCGLLTFNNRENKLDDMFDEDKEIILFESKEELLDKIIHYKNNDTMRKKIAEGGWAKSHQDLNEKIIARYMLEAIFEQKASDYIWPTDKY